MKGYRFLDIGEKVRSGDEAYEILSCGWVSVSRSIGKIVDNNRLGYYRRKINKQTKNHRIDLDGRLKDIGLNDKQIVSVKNLIANNYRRRKRG